MIAIGDRVRIISPSRLHGIEGVIQNIHQDTYLVYVGRYVYKLDINEIESCDPDYTIDVSDEVVILYGHYKGGKGKITNKNTLSIGTRVIVEILNPLTGTIDSVLFDLHLVTKIKPTIGIVSQRYQTTEFDHFKKQEEFQEVEKQENWVETGLDILKKHWSDK